MANDTLIRLPGFASDSDGAHHFFGTRQGGSLPPGEYGNHDVTSAERHLHGERSPLQHVLLGVRVVSVKQVHGTNALVVAEGMPPREVLEQGWDALVTAQPGVCLTVKTADCVPVLVHDLQCGVIAAIHAGWRGAVAGILPKTLRVMQERFGTEARHLRIGIGPSAGVCCYEVDEPVLERVREQVVGWRKLLHEAQGDRAKLHLRELVRQQAIEAGVASARVGAVDLCTICRPELFYSYRREGQVRGTMVSGIMMTGRA